MRAINVGIGHDDDAFITQIVGVAVLARPTTKRELKVGDFIVGANFVGGGGCDVEDFAAYRQYRLRLAVTRLLCAAACAVAFDDEQFGAGGIIGSAIGQLAGQAYLSARRRGLALDFALGLAAKPVVDLFQNETHQSLAALHIVSKIMVKMVAHRVFDETRCLGRGQPVLGLALKLRVADKHRQHQFSFVEDILRRNLRGFLLAD